MAGSGPAGPGLKKGLRMHIGADLHENVLFTEQLCFNLILVISGQIYKFLSFFGHFWKICDDFQSIALRFAVTKEELKRVNNLFTDADLITKKDLLIPDRRLTAVPTDLLVVCQKKNDLKID